MYVMRRTFSDWPVKNYLSFSCSIVSSFEDITTNLVMQDTFTEPVLVEESLISFIAQKVKQNILLALYDFPREELIVSTTWVDHGFKMVDYLNA